MDACEKTRGEKKEVSVNKKSRKLRQEKAALMLELRKKGTILGLGEMS